MSRSDGPAAELRGRWTLRGILETELAVDHKGTIVQRPPMSSAAAAWPAALGELPDATGGPGPLVVLGDELGRGGMGLVRTATQASLGRDVAVKTPLGAQSAIEALLREAWISGLLEHPNVVPVYALYRHGTAPMMVMRRVEGHEWSLTERGPDQLEPRLRTLVQVCHAVHFAHTRGIVHLDLKPNNIMLGSYGEIYLLDWGIAVCIREDLPSFLPRARDVNALRGTPAYMSPELAEGDGRAIDARTDVYLLGAILHEILTGEPPHVAPTLLATLTSAYLSQPRTYAAGVPQELAAIANRALSRRPDDRFGSAAQLREALEDYLVHADSLGLQAAAQSRLERIAAREEGDHGSVDVDRLAAEAEFGFRQALHVWPENVAARVALQSLIERLIERDLAEQRWQVAERRLADLPEPRPELAREVQRLRAASATTAVELERLRHDADLGTSAVQRSGMAYLGALLWCAALVALGQLDHWGLVVATHWHMLVVTLGGTLIFATMVHRNRRELFVNAINRNAVALLGVGFVLGDLFWVGAWAAGTPFDAAVFGVFPVCVFVIAGHAASVDRRLVPHSIVAIVGYLLVLPFPSWGLEALGVVGGVVLAMLGWTWRAPGDVEAGRDGRR
jgi:hypothetical protein